MSKKKFMRRQKQVSELKTSIKENYGILLQPLFRLWTLFVHTVHTCRNLQFVPNFSFPYPVIFVNPLLRCTIG